MVSVAYAGPYTSCSNCFWLTSLPGLGQDLEQVPLGGGQPDLAAGCGYALGREVDREGGGFDHGDGLGGGGPAQRGADAGEQLVHSEGLGDVVVGIGIEGGDPERCAVGDPPNRSGGTCETA